jgi:hypothetical protein
MLLAKNYTTRVALVISLASPVCVLPQGLSASAADDNKQAISAAAALATNGDEMQDLQSALKEMKVTIDRIDRTTKEFVREASRQRVTLQDVPDGMDWNTYAVPAVDNIAPGGTLPMRQDRVSLYRSDIDQLVPILGGDIESVHIPQALGEDAMVEWQAATSAMLSLHDSEGLLDELTAGPEYKNNLIIKQVKRIHDDVQGIDDIRKKVLKRIKKVD